jgi:O2-independent ubiquinone biosynthesis accessory factor UbiT
MDKTLAIPKFRLPGFVAGIGRRLPQWPHAVALVAGLNAALAMKLLPADDLAALEGKLFCVRPR